MKEVTIPKYSVFIGHVFVFPAVAWWKGQQALRYHIYVFPEDTDLKDAEAILNGTSFGRMMAWTKAGVGKGKDSTEEDTNSNVDDCVNIHADKQVLGSHSPAIED